MPGVKGRSGPQPPELRIHCEHQLRTFALPKMTAYLEEAGPKDATWRWVVETYARWSGVESAQQIEVSGTLDLRAEAETFQGRVNRLVARLGAAAMPEGID